MIFRNDTFIGLKRITRKGNKMMVLGLMILYAAFAATIMWVNKDTKER